MKKKLVTLLTLSLFSAINCTDKKIITKSKQPWYTKVAKTSSEILKETFTYKSFRSDIFTVPIATSILETYSRLTCDEYTFIKDDWKNRSFLENVKHPPHSHLTLDFSLFFLKLSSFLLRAICGGAALFSDPEKELKFMKKMLIWHKTMLKTGQEGLKRNVQIYQRLKKEKYQDYISYYKKEIIKDKREIASLYKDIEEHPENIKNLKHIGYACLLRPIIFKTIFYPVFTKISQYKIKSHQDHKLCTSAHYSRESLKLEESDRKKYLCHIVTLMKKHTSNENYLECLAENAIAKCSNEEDVTFILSQLDKSKHMEARVAIIKHQTVFNDDTIIKDYPTELKKLMCAPNTKHTHVIYDIETIKKYQELISNKTIDMKITNSFLNKSKLNFQTITILPSKSTLKIKVSLDINKIDAKYKIFSNNLLDAKKTAEKIIKEIEPTYGMTKNKRFEDDFVGRKEELHIKENGKTIAKMPAGLVHILKNQETNHHKNLMNHLKTISTLKEQCNYILEWAMDKSLKSENTTIFHYVFSHKDFNKLEEKTKYSLIEKMIENNLENYSDKKTRWFIFDNSETPLDILRKSNKELYNYALELSEMQEVD